MECGEVGRQLRLGSAVEAQQVVRKAEELRSLCQIRNPYGFQGKQASLGAICVELACRIFQVEFDKNEIIKRSSASSARAYGQLLTTVSNTLGLNLQIDFQTLGSLFCCPDVASMSETVFQSFQERFLERVRQEGRSSTNFHRPAFLAATFFLCSRKMRQSVDKRKLAREVGCNSKEFSEACTAIHQLCFDLVGVGGKSHKVGEQASRHGALLNRLVPQEGAEGNGSGEEEEEMTESILDGESSGAGMALKRRKLETSFSTAGYSSARQVLESDLLHPEVMVEDIARFTRWRNTLLSSQPTPEPPPRTHPSDSLTLLHAVLDGQ